MEKTQQSSSDSKVTVGDGTPYQITVTMTPADATSMMNQGFNLYAFKTVNCGINGGAPLVWFKMSQYDASNVISWTEDYQAYASNSQIIANGQIVSSTSETIVFGQIFQLQEGPMGSVLNGGNSEGISIQNMVSGTAYTCGVSQNVNGNLQQLCAFPVDGGGSLDLITPIEKVLLMFATNEVNTGVVLEQAYTEGLLIDLTGNNNVTVSYVFNGGWEWGNEGWGTAIAANSNVVPMLTQDKAPPSSSKQPSK